MTRKDAETIRTATNLDTLYPLAARLEGDAASVALAVGRIMSADGAPKRKDAIAAAKRYGYRAGQSAGYYSQVVKAYRAWHPTMDDDALTDAYRTHGYYALYLAAELVPADATLSEEDVARIVSESTQRRTGGKATGTAKRTQRRKRTAKEVADTQDATVETYQVTITGDIAAMLAVLVEASGMTVEEVLDGIIRDAHEAYQAVGSDSE